MLLAIALRFVFKVTYHILRIWSRCHCQLSISLNCGSGNLMFRSDYGMAGTEEQAEQ